MKRAIICLLTLLWATHVAAQTPPAGTTIQNNVTPAIGFTTGHCIGIAAGNKTTDVACVTGGSGVTSVSVVSANGLAGTVATPTTTPAITLSTSITGLLKGNGTAISAAAAGTDYAAANASTTVNGTSCALSSTCTVTAAAGTLTGGTLTSGVTASSLTSLGTLTSLAVAGTTTITSTSASSLTVGRQGATNPVLQVDASTASVATGVVVKGAATGGGVTITAIDSGSNTNLSINGKGTGSVGIANLTSGGFTIGHSGGAAAYAGDTHTITTAASSTAFSLGPNGSTTPILSVDTSTASSVAGLNIKGAATGGTVALVATDSGSNTNLTLNAKGTGTLVVGGTSTGQVTIGGASTSAKLGGSTGTVVASGSTITLAGVTTGTNADFLCLSSGGVVLLQTSACTISSARFKNDIKLLKVSGLRIIEQLHPVSFRMREGEHPNPDPNFARTQIGLTAENVAGVDRRLAIYEDDMITPKSYRQESLIAVLIKSVQELNARVIVLEGRR